MRRIDRITFSRREIKDLSKAWVATSIAFTIFFLTGFGIAASLPVLLVISALTAGVGFLLHELMHKFVAHRYGVYGEFHSNDMMLLGMILFAFLGFIIAAPGAVYLMGQPSRKASGHISVAGPLTNIALAGMFIPLAFLPGWLGLAGRLGAIINGFLGAFNMLPFPSFDGAKVLAWDKTIYGVVLVLGIASAIVAYLL